MSKYVTHKHGLTLGSGNMFFVIDRPSEEGEPPIFLPTGISDFRDGYMAIVAFEPLVYDEISTINCDLKSSANQLVFNPNKIHWPHTWTYEKGGIETVRTYEKTKRFLTLKSYWENWLEKEVGPKFDMWDTYTRSNRSEGCIFFKKRGDALKFINKIKEFLKGERFGY